MTRTLVVSHFFPPESLGGAHRWKQLINSLSDDHTCRVVCPPPAYPYGEFNRSWKPIEHDTIDGVAVTRLWTYQPRGDSTSEEANAGRILNYMAFSIYAGFYVLCNFWRYDNIITVSSPHTTFLPGIIGQELGMSWVADIFDLWLDNAVDLGYVQKDTLPYRFIESLERRAIRRSDQSFVITETMAEHFADKYNVSITKFTLVPFGIDEELFSICSNIEDSNTVVYTGNMGETHAFRPFIRAFKQLGDVQLRLIGTGKRQKELERLCEEEGLIEQVKFEGVVPREEIPEILGTASLSIVPLKQRHHLDYARPNKLLESMAVGTPYVASAIREINRITEESNAGYTVDNDAEKIAEAIRTLLQNRERRIKMGERGAAFIDREHRWPQLANRVDQAIHDVV